MSVDGTDFQIQQFQPFSKRWYGKKFNGPGVRYEIGVCILTGWIVWLHGPFPCGMKNDLQVFRHALVNFLEENERVECDKGYRGEPRNARIPNASDSDDVASIRHRVGQRHETINKRLKQFKCLKNIWRHSLMLQSAATRAVVVITQLGIENGEEPFQVDYDDSTW